MSSENHPINELFKIEKSNTHICNICNKVFESKKALTSHINWHNPEHRKKTIHNPNNKKPDVLCDTCGKYFSTLGIGKHKKYCLAIQTNKELNKKNCPVCNKLFYTNSKTCSYSCANTFFRTAKDHPNYNHDNYRHICFDYNNKVCVICGEDKIVHVHHINGEHYDNTPKNLVPLCPTHHQYMHSKYKILIEHIIEEYINDKFHTQS